MNKNIKRMFFVLTLVMLLVTVGAVSAADDANSTAAVDSSVSDATSDHIVAESVTTTSNDNKVDAENNTIEKEDKNLKKSTKTVEVNDGNELRTTVNNAINDLENSEYIINLNEGAYVRNTYSFNEGQNQPHIILNGNKQLITGMIVFNSKCNFSINSLILNGTQYQNNNCNITLNNVIINGKLTNQANGYLYLNNSTINNKITNRGNLIISDDCVLTDKFSLDNSGTVIMNNTDKLAFYQSNWNGNYTFRDVQVNGPRTNDGNITFINSILNSTITNNGNMTISDDTIFGENFVYSGTGNIIINDTNRIIPYLTSFNGYTLENVTFNKTVSFGGENTLINCTFENIKANMIITNEGNLTLINCTIRNSLTQANGALINNRGNLYLLNTIIDDNIINTTDTNIYGFIHNYYGNNIANLTLNNVTFSNNKIIYNNSLSSTIFGFINCDKNNLILLNESKFINNSVFKCNGDQGNGITYNNDSCIIYGASNSKIYNSLFENNTASAITGSDLNISNSIFKNNTRIINARSIDSPSAKAIVDLIGNNNIDSCQFIDNLIIIGNSQAFGFPGGAVRATKSEILGSYASTNITNCLFDSNGIECNSSWLTVNGAAISGTNLTIINNNFTNNYIDTVKGVHIIGSYFENDYHISGWGVDICTNATSTIKNNLFINSTTNQAIGSIYSDSLEGLIEIKNNTFINCNANNDTIRTINTEKNIQDNTFTNCTIEFKSLNLTAPNKIYSNEDITVSLDIELAYPENYDSDILEKTDYEWYINGETTTDKDTSKTISVGTDNVIVYVTPTVSNNRTRVLAIAPTILNDIIITPDNINNYVFDGELIASPNSRLIFQGEFNNLGEIFNNKNQVFFEGSNATFTNTSFKIEANDNTIQNMNINNTDTSEYIIINIGNNNIIQNNTLTQYNSNGKTAAIYSLNSQNTLITNNKINVKGPSVAIQYGETAAIANTQAILDESGTNNQITHNTITVANTTDAELDAFGTIEAITAPKGTNNTISYNVIECTGARFNYGINTLDNVLENTITYNNITVTGYRYTDGIQLGNGANNNYIANNNINLTCLNDTPVDEAAISYGIIVTSQGGQTADNNTVTQNNILINGVVNYGMEIYTATNTLITENNITLTGVKSMAIGYAHSPNSTVTNNNIIINDDTTQPLNGVTEEIQPQSVGIQLQQDSDNILIENNTITTNDKAKTDKTINTEALNTTIKNNQLTSSTGYGADTIQTTMQDTIIENNTIETTTTLEVPETIITNTPTTLTATVTIDETPINGGTITFTKDNEVLAQATVTNGTATATVTFKEAEDTTIVASYTPESSGLSTSSAEAATSIQAPQTQLNIEDVELAAGETVTLTAKVTDQAGNNITGGKVIFKVNGKTVKDANGKVIYAKVVDGVASVEYVIPDSLAGKDVNITAVYSGSTKYNKESTTITKTVAAQEPTLTITPITDDVQTGSTITLKTKIAAGDKAITTGKIVFKINGKTVKDANGKVIYAKVDANGEVSVDYNLGNLKAGTYTIEATFIAPSYDKITSNTTMTVVKA